MFPYLPCKSELYSPRHQGLAISRPRQNPEFNHPTLSVSSKAEQQSHKYKKVRALLSLSRFLYSEREQLGRHLRQQPPEPLSCAPAVPYCRVDAPVGFRAVTILAYEVKLSVPYSESAELHLS